MSHKHLICHDYAACQELIRQAAPAFDEQPEGLECHTAPRTVIPSLAAEAMEDRSVVLAQLDPGAIHGFIPSRLSPGHAATLLDDAERRAVEMLGARGRPLIIELLTGQADEPAVQASCRIESWMDPDFLRTVVQARRALIVLFFDGENFFRETLKPQLERRGFAVTEGYEESARAGVLRARHPSTPGTVYKLPWVLWVREMMGGGYDTLFLMALFAVYLQKMEQAVVAGGSHGGA
jgi:hypothetical protein